MNFIYTIIKALLFFIIIYFLYSDTKRIFRAYLRHVERKLLILHILKLLFFSVVTFIFKKYIPYSELILILLVILIISFLVTLSIRQVEVELKKDASNKNKFRTFQYKNKFMKYFLLLLANISNFDSFFKHKKFIKIATKELFYVAIFPAQKYIAVSLSSFELTQRKEKFISNEQLKQIQNTLNPGDILLKRNDWQATNIGIPGFWTHTGLYIGTLEEMDNYFANIDELNNTTFSEYLKINISNIYAKLKENNTLTVIESIEEGVSLKNLSNIAKSDYFSALRPNLTKSDKFNAIINAINLIGKPYDYHFNSKSKEAFICSEVIKESYKNKLNLIYSKKLGKKICYPNSIAYKYALEYKKDNRELDFVIFYDLNLNTKKARQSTNKDFIKSYKRNILYYRKRDLIKYFSTIGLPIPFKKE